MIENIRKIVILSNKKGIHQNRIIKIIPNNKSSKIFMIIKEKITIQNMKVASRNNLKKVAFKILQNKQIKVQLIIIRHKQNINSRY